MQLFKIHHRTGLQVHALYNEMQFNSILLKIQNIARCIVNFLTKLIYKECTGMHVSSVKMQKYLYSVAVTNSSLLYENVILLKL